MNEQQQMQITKTMLSDREPLPILIEIKDAWLIISALQLATRHPELGEPLKQDLEEIGRQFQDAITGKHPLAEQLIEMGWDTEFDAGGDSGEPASEQWFLDTTNQMVNGWLDKTFGTPFPSALNKLSFAVIDVLKAAYAKGRQDAQAAKPESGE